LPLLFNVALDYSIRKVPENQDKLELNATRRLLVCNDDVTILGENTNAINKNTEALLQAKSEVGLEVNVERIKHMFISH
jgi:hypothetical protein